MTRGWCHHDTPPPYQVELGRSVQLIDIRGLIPELSVTFLFGEPSLNNQGLECPLNCATRSLSFLHQEPKGRPANTLSVRAIGKREQDEFFRWR